jgi:hypothetical protein
MKNIVCDICGVNSVENPNDGTDICDDGLDICEDCLEGKH